MFESVTGAVPGNGVCVAAGFEGAVEEAFSMSSEFLEAPTPLLGINYGERMQSTAIRPANIQVPFSSTSVVCFTPINWLPTPPNVPASPPPLGFCTNTIKPNITAIRITKIANNNISLFFYLVNFGGKVSAFRGIEQT